MDRAMETACREELRRAGLPGQGTLVRLLALLFPERDPVGGTGKPSRANSSATCSAKNLERLYAPTMLFTDTGLASSPSPSFGTPMQPTVLV